MKRRRWFLPESTDVLALLRQQGEVTIEGVAAFRRWSEGHREDGEAVRRAEHRADEVRRDLQLALRRAFVTPLDAEDIYELSERLDRVLNSAKNAVREAEIMDMPADSHMAEMASLIEQGTRCLTSAFETMANHPDSDLATTDADKAIKHQRRLEHAYRGAMSALLGEQSVAEVTGRRELYRRYARIGDAIEHVADRIWYAIVKVR